MSAIEKFLVWADELETRWEIRDHSDLLLFTEENQWTLGNADYEWTWLAVARVHLSAVCTFEGGGKGVLTSSQVATGEENGLTLRVYAEKGAIKWDHETPNYLELYRYGEPRQILTGGQAYLSEAAVVSARIPPGHPEGYLEGFATIYVGVVEAIRQHIDGKPLKSKEYNFPTVYDGLRGMQFIYKAVESCEKGSTWVSMEGL